MCDTCHNIGLVDQIDGHPVRFVRTVLRPKQCDQAIEASLYLTIHDQEWRPVLEDDPMHALAAAEQKYIPLSKIPSLSRRRVSWLERLSQIFYRSTYIG